MEPENKMTDARQVVVPVQVALSLAVGFLVLFGAGCGYSIWWASSISTKMDTLVKQGTEQAAANMANSTRITALELWQRQIDATGTPAMTKKTEETARELSELREAFNLHKATTSPTAKP